MGFMDKLKQGAQQAQMGMGGGGMTEARDRYMKLNKSGVDRRAAITSLSETGRKDIGGSPEFDIGLRITPEDGEPYETTIKQFMQKDQAKLYSVGKEVGVKVDPDDPNVAVLWG